MWSFAELSLEDIVVLMIGDKVIHLPVVDSTNNFLRDNHERFTHGTVVIANLQTRGRGRNNREWFSPEGGLWFSILFKPRKPLKPTFFTKVASLAVHQVLNKIGVQNKIKWPNDIYVSGKKLCGILTETIYEGERPKIVICGIGMNVNNEITKDIADKAISLSQITGRNHDLNGLLKMVINKMNQIVKKYYTKPEALTRVWKERLMHREGEQIKFLLNGVTATGRLIKIEDDFIVVELENRQLRISSLEVVVS